MNIRRTSLTGLAALAAVASVSLIAPAASADPKLPDNCTFDRDSGTSTCTTTTVGDKTYEDSYYVMFPADDSITGTFCAVRSPGYFRYGGQVGGATVSKQTTTTTTSTFQGAYNAHKPTSSTSSSTTTYTIERGAVGCYSYTPGVSSSWARFFEGDTAVVTS